METPQQEKAMRYLLGKLSEQEAAEFEAQYFDDDALFHETTDLENDLLHSYLRGELSESERQEFEAGYLISPARRQKLEFAQALEGRVFETDRAPVLARPGTMQERSSAGVNLATQSWRVRLVPAAIALAVVVTISWLVITNYRLNRELGQMRAEEAELRYAQQELEAKILTLTSRLQQSVANSHGEQKLFPPLQKAEIMAFSLAPGLPRSAGAIKQFIIPPGMVMIQLQLYLEEDKYSSYRATLEATGGKQITRKSGLKSHADSHGHLFVSFEIPSHTLNRGDYVVKLDGVAGAGEVEENITAYRFVVAGR